MSTKADLVIDFELSSTWRSLSTRNTDGPGNEPNWDVRLPTMLTRVTPFYVNAKGKHRIIDLSHTSEAAMHQVLGISKAPVMFSHSAM